ncbi:MAG: RNA polymerase sporulation sigma factor SigE [Christensenellales bacterium]
MLKKLMYWLFRFFGVENNVDYIGTGEVLPNPLDSEDELKTVEKLMNGDEEARKKLIEHNLRLVIYIAKKFDNTGIDIEDLISVGTIGLIKAVNSFKMDKQIKLATYASRCIENEILMYLRKSVKSRGDVSLDEPLNVDWDGNTLLLSDVLGTDSDVVSQNVDEEADRDILRKSLDVLSPRERQIIKMRFGILGTQKKTQKEIADMMGISQSYISRLEKKVMGKLKKEITKMV